MPKGVNTVQMEIRNKIMCMKRSKELKKPLRKDSVEPGPKGPTPPPPLPSIAAPALLLEQDDVDVVVDALEKQLPLVGDDLLFLGRPQGPDQSLKDLGAAVVVEQDLELHGGVAVGI